MKVLIVVDMQNDFIDGALGTNEAKSIIPNVVKRIKDSEHDELILFTKDTHGSDYLNTPEGKKLPVPHCIVGTSGFEINNEIFSAWQSKKDTKKLTDIKDNTFNKSVFGSVELASYLKTIEKNIESIELIGVCTDICVVSNAIIIKNTLPNTKIVVRANCCAGVTPKTHESALETMGMCQIDVI